MRTKLMIVTTCVALGPCWGAAVLGIASDNRPARSLSADSSIRKSAASAVLATPSLSRAGEDDGASAAPSGFGERVRPPLSVAGSHVTLSVDETVAVLEKLRSAVEANNTMAGYLTAIQSQILQTSAQGFDAGKVSEIMRAISSLKEKASASGSREEALRAVLGLATGQDPVAVAREQNQTLAKLNGILRVSSDEDMAAAAARIIGAHAADITALRADFEARMAAKDREHAAAQARIAEIEAKLATATSLLGETREGHRAAVRDALTAKSTAAGAQAEALEKFLSEPARAKGSSRAPRGYGAVDSARQPLLAAEHPGASAEATDPATTLAALRADRDRLATEAREAGSRSLTPPRTVIDRALTGQH